MTQLEEVKVEDDEDMGRLLHQDIPKALRELMHKVGLTVVSLYHLKDDLLMYEYVADCLTDEDRCMALAFTLTSAWSLMYLLTCSTALSNPLLVSKVLGLSYSIIKWP